MKLKITKQSTGESWIKNPPYGCSSEDKVERAIFDKLSYQGGGGCHVRYYYGEKLRYTIVK
jgi:hypothetical protein